MKGKKPAMRTEEPMGEEIRLSSPFEDGKMI